MSIRTVGVVGAGTMGNGIAQICATAEFDVVMVDLDAAALQRGLGSIAASLDRMVRKETLSAADKAGILARVAVSAQTVDLAAADIVIEAATENEALKQRIFQGVDGILPAHAILATNTSSISISRLAAATHRPDRFIGMHFFNPVPLMVLVEIVRGLQTSDATHAAVEDFARRLGKTPICAGNRPGFAVNRILSPMINEAIFALQDGVASAQDIDAAMQLGCNHPIGPLALADLVGLDTVLAVMEVFHAGFGDPKYRPAPLLREMVDAGYLGRKTGRGFFVYSE